MHCLQCSVVIGRLKYIHKKIAAPLKTETFLNFIKAVTLNEEQYYKQTLTSYIFSTPIFD